MVVVVVDWDGSANGKTSVLQAEVVGSIPTRSKFDHAGLRYPTGAVLSFVTYKVFLV